MSKIFRLISFLLFSLCITVSSNAQDMTNIRAEQMSDSQIKNLMQKAASIGYNDAQIEQMAIAQGMDEDEAAKLLKRVKDLRKKEASDSIPGKQRQTSDRNASSLFDLNKNNLNNNEPGEQNIDSIQNPGPKIFGADLFKNPDISFQPDMNMPTPQGYIIGPGDELLIDLTGDNVANYNLKVSPEGFINMEYVGKISVGGLSIEEAISKVKNKMSGTYPALKNGRSQVSVNLGNIRSIKITILGEVTRPGSYTLSSLSTVFNALYASGGPNKNGSFRTIEVIRNNKVVTTIDIYDFLLKGMQAHNIRLQDQDVIRIPVYQTRVEAAGEVKRPALYEVLPGENLADILAFAGGFATKAYTASVKVFQNTELERRITDVPKAEFEEYVPRNSDKYIVESILDRFENRIEIRGAVFRPGYFELKQGLTLKTLIGLARGLKEDAFLQRGYIYRLKPDNTQELISFNVGNVVNGHAADIALQREDIVQISSIFDLRDEYSLSIEGAVRNPGTFKYADNITIGSLIQMAGGFREGASPGRIEVARRIKNTEAASSTSVKTAQIFTVNVDTDLNISPSDFKLEPYDIVIIRNLAGYETQVQVKVEGEVVYPGTYTLENKNITISDIIKRAGGLTAFAYADGASLRRPGIENPTDKNAISRDMQEEQLLNVQRLSTDSTPELKEATQLEQIYTSDQVGIDLKKILDNPHKKQDLIMQSGDILQVPKLLQTVKVNGEVLRPNNIAYSKNRLFKSYINGAGGFTQRALKKASFIQYANGSVYGTKKFLFFNNYPEVKPGAEIWVPKRAARERISPQFWVGIGSTVATLVILAYSLLK